MQQLQMQALNELKQQLENVSDARSIPDLSEKNFVEDAKRRVALGLLLSEVLEKFEIKLDDDRMRDKVDEIAALYQEPEQVREMIFRDEKRLKELEALVLEEQIADVLLANMQVVETNIDYDKLLNS